MRSEISGPLNLLSFQLLHANRFWPTVARLIDTELAATRKGELGYQAIASILGGVAMNVVLLQFSDERIHVIAHQKEFMHQCRGALWWAGARHRRLFLWHHRTRHEPSRRTELLILIGICFLARHLLGAARVSSCSTQRRRAWRRAADEFQGDGGGTPPELAGADAGSTGASSQRSGTKPTETAFRKPPLYRPCAMRAMGFTSVANCMRWKRAWRPDTARTSVISALPRVKRMSP